ncbi:F-box/LRR-repeat protein At3g48880-like [Rosa rugosa]|uniref:F-box/LRR-repeat protein At3g48880-like n=1 Tax=Rosa rugosa TaxID=74645 RepID=UPI002B408DE5|nr:F-box/LRR-repeat protein At3g48880-like [Rosa rugosa]XP_061991103.1 F-box/LRR-repeat protein At3g48880-like [Rosa rugosa]
MEDQRMWEDLNTDCLVNIFGRVGMESLLLDIPFVCKSWYKASLIPSCWQCIIFPDFSADQTFDFSRQGVEPNTICQRFLSEFRIDKSHFSSTAFMKCVINHSRGKATSITLPAYCTQEAVEFVAHECPDLVFLDISRYLLFTPSRKLISDLICKWENLVELWLSWSYNLEKILSQISVHCKSFCSLRVSYASIHKDEALTITTLVPNIKYLNLRSADFDRDSLVSILRSCKSLVLLDVRDCVGFNEADEEILKLSSHISKFICEGSKEELFIIP